MNFEEKLNHGFELLKDKDIDHALDIARELQKKMKTLTKLIIWRR